jgi:hypothetical protein
MTRLEPEPRHPCDRTSLPQRINAAGQHRTNQDDDRNYEQEMDQTAANVAKKAKKPEHDQDNNYSPEHTIPFG